METFWDTLRACADLLEDIDAKRASDLRYIADRLEERAEPPTDTGEE